MQTILVVEDEVDIVQVVVAIMEYAGYRTVTAGNGLEALACLETTRPALILSDVMMPVMDGRELCKRLYAHPQHSSIPVVLMSAAYKPLLLGGYKPAAFLKKPFEATELIELVNEVLGVGEDSKGQ